MPAHEHEPPRSTVLTPLASAGFSETDILGRAEEIEGRCVRDDPALQGEMTVRVALSDPGGGTELVAVHDGLPPGLSPADNELGWRLSLGKLAERVETA